MNAPSRPGDDVIARAIRTVAFRDAAKELDFVAVCLIGHGKQIPVDIGSNRTVCPVEVVWSRDPERAAEAKDRGCAVHPLHTLRYVWTRREIDAKRLKAALDVRILGEDPEMVALRKGFRDLPEWEVAWDILLKDALDDLRANGEPVEILSEDMRIQRTLNFARDGR